MDPTSRLLFMGAGGAEGLGYTDWGGGQPAFTASTTYPLTDISGHYGMTTDSWHRYAIIFPRGTEFTPPTRQLIWIPITATGLDMANRFYVNYPVYDGTDPGNNFGGLVDTKRGFLFHPNYNASIQKRYTLPAQLSGLQPGITPSITAGSTLTLTRSSAGDLSYNVSSSGGNDGGHHAGWDDVYYFAGRNVDYYILHNPVTNSLISQSSFSTTRERYGVCKDPSSNYLFIADRTFSFFMTNGVTGSEINISGNSFNTDIEDVIVGWTGDAYTFVTGGVPTPTSSDLQRYIRTA